MQATVAKIRPNDQQCLGFLLAQPAAEEDADRAADARGGSQRAQSGQVAAGLTQQEGQEDRQETDEGAHRASRPQRGRHLAQRVPPSAAAGDRRAAETPGPLLTRVARSTWLGKLNADRVPMMNTTAQARSTQG